ncbi:MAG: thioredoxin family protein [Candidatus Hodarchaeales archaeon]
MKKREIFNKLFDNGISYENYVKKSDKYNERMNDSWLATQKGVQEFKQEKIMKMNKRMHVLCIAENWCIDCANGVPVISKLADMLSNWNFRIVSRDDYREDFELHFTTAGRNKIPIIIFADEDGDEILRWIERPMRSYQLLGKLKDQNLPQEEFIERYHDTVEFKPPIVSEEILSELVPVVNKVASIIQVNPPSKKRPPTN